MHAFKHGARAGKAGTAEQSGLQTRLCRPAGMQPLGPGALGQILDDARRHRSGSAERVHQLLGVEFQRRADAGGRPHGAEHRGRMKAGLVGERRRHGGEPAHRLNADRDAKKRRAAIQLVPLAGRQYGRHDHRAGMNRAAFERVVEILAVDGRAIDHRRFGRRQRAGMTDGGARPVILARRERGAHVILVARRDREPDHVDQSSSHLARTACGKRAASSAQIFCARISARAILGRSLADMSGVPFENSERFHVVIASEAKQSSAAAPLWIASSLRSSQ